MRIGTLPQMQQVKELSLKVRKLMDQLKSNGLRLCQRNLSYE